MPTRSHRIGMLLAVLAMLAGAVVARAGGFAGEPSRIVVPGEVRAGDSVELEWVAPDGVLELELELSLDDGRTWSRLSPELPGAAQSWTWCVPNLASACARLRLRVGTDCGEYDLEPTEPFCILQPADAATPAPQWPRVDGSAPLPHTLGPPHARLEEARLPSHVDAPTRLVLEEPLPLELQSSRRSLPRMPQPTSHAFLTTPRFVPLRN